MNYLGFSGPFTMNRALKYFKRASLCLVSLMGFGLSSDLYADALTGDAGLARSDIEGTALNPANLGFSRLNQFHIRLNLLEEENLFIQYQGLEPINKRTRESFISRKLNTLQTYEPIQNILSVPKYNMSYSVVVLPPIPLQDATIKLKRIPIVTLDSINYVDLEVTDVTLNGFLTAKAGMRLSSKLAAGASVRYVGFSSSTKAIVTDTQEQFLSLKQTVSIINARYGLRYDINRNLSFGFVSDLVRGIAIDIESDILPPVEIAPLSIKTPVDGFGLGTRYKSGRMTLWADTYYTAAEKIEAPSLSTLTVKEKDTYPTLSLRLGGRFTMKRNFALLAGFRREPANIGPGGPEADDKGGYGPLEMIQLVSTGAQLTPFNQYSAGFQYRLGKKIIGSKSKGKKKRRKKKRSFNYYHPFIINTGVIIREASLGIDENGEQPGAYDQSLLSIPVNLTYRF